MQIIFQDPFASLNPRLTVGQALGEVLAVHQICRKEEIPARVDELLRMVGLPVTAKDRFPRSFSGGQQQRVGIARALAAAPSLLVADEAVSKLDVSVQVQILNLLRQLQRDLGLTILIVAHDLAVVRYVSQRVAVMYLGAIVEFATTDELFSRPSHPYTRALLSAVPKLQPGTRQRTAVAARGSAKPSFATERLPVSHPLSQSGVDLCPSSAAIARDRAGAPGGLSFRGRTPPGRSSDIDWHLVLNVRRQAISSP